MKTRSRSILTLLSFALFVVLVTGCKKDKDNNNNNSSKNVKYELTGTFSGKFTVYISDNESGSQTIANVSLPWSKEVTYNNKVLAIGIGAVATTEGAAGQTAFLKIFSGGTVVKSTNSTTDNLGSLSLPALAHTF